MNFPFQPQGPSTIATTGAASAAIAMPEVNGAKARYLRFIASGRCIIQLGNSDVVAAAATGIRLAANVPEIINVSGWTHIAHIDGADASVTISMTPVELSVPR